jgi:hypothetical protein
MSVIYKYSRNFQILTLEIFYLSLAYLLPTRQIPNRKNLISFNRVALALQEILFLYYPQYVQTIPLEL